MEDKKNNKLLSEIEFSRVTREDSKLVSDLITSMHPISAKVSWQRSRSPEYYKWMYFENPVGDAVAYCAKHNGKIVSTFAMVPKLFQFDGKPLIVGKTMDIFTQESYQGLGLMSKVSKLVFEETKKNMTKFWYVTPSKNSYPIFKNKWKYIEPMKLYYIINILDLKELLSSITNNTFLNMFGKIPFSALSQLNSNLNMTKPDKLHKIDRIDDRADALWKLMSSDRGISIIRNEKYLHWRYVANPDDYKLFYYNSSGQIDGMIVLKFTKRKSLKIGEIVDLIYPLSNPHVATEMIKSALWYLKENGCIIAHTWSNRGSQLYDLFKKCGFYFQRKEVKLLLSPDAPMQEFYDQSKWFFTQGDGNDV